MATSQSNQRKMEKTHCPECTTFNNECEKCVENNSEKSESQDKSKNIHCSDCTASKLCEKCIEKMTSEENELENIHCPECATFNDRCEKCMEKMTSENFKPQDELKKVHCSNCTTFNNECKGCTNELTKKAVDIFWFMRMIYCSGHVRQMIPKLEIIIRDKLAEVIDNLLAKPQDAWEKSFFHFQTGCIHCMNVIEQNAHLAPPEIKESAELLKKLIESMEIIEKLYIGSR